MVRIIHIAHSMGNTSVQEIFTTMQLPDFVNYIIIYFFNKHLYIKVSIKGAVSHYVLLFFPVSFFL